MASVLLLALAACGGGGGGGGGDDNDGPSGITLSTTSLTFSANHDDAGPPPAQTVTVTVLGGGVNGNPLFMKIDGATSPVDDPSISCGGTSQCTLRVPVNPPDTHVNPGRYEGSVTVIGCSDQFCNSGPVANGRKSVSVSYDISPGFSLSEPSLSFSGAEGGAAPAAQTITLSKSSGTLNPWHTSVTYTSAGATDWLTLSPESTAAATPSGSTVQVAVAAGLTEGNYTATIHFSAQGSPRRIPLQIAYFVRNALNAPPVVTFILDEATLPSGLQRTINMTNGSPQPLGWSATENVPWFQLSRTQGDTASANDLQISLIAATIERMPMANHRGAIAIAPTGGATFTPFEVSVSLHLNLPLANFATPYVVNSGASGEVYVRGSGFTALPGAVLIDGAAATHAVRDHDTQLRFGHAGLTAGTHTIDIGIAANAAGLNRDRVKLVALDPVDFNAASIATAGTKSAAVYDAERQALYVADSENTEIERYRWNGTAWAADALDISGVLDLAPMPDGKQLLALRARSVAHVDLDTFSLAFTRTTATSGIGNRALAIANDGGAVIPRAEFTSTGEWRGSANALQYDSVLGSVTTRLESNTGAAQSTLGGSKLYVLDSLVNRMDVIDSLTREVLVQAPVPLTARTLAAANDGKFIVNAVDVYGVARTKIGTLSATETLQASALSPDGARAYAYGDTNRLLYVFDLAAPNGSGGFNQVGAPVAVSASPGGVPLIVISTDGRTAFVVGTTTMNVTPLPH